MKMQITFEQNNLILHQVSCLNLALTLDCGQAFRWRQSEDGKWHGVAMGQPLTLEQKENTLILYDTTIETYQKNWKKYFDFDRDYDAILQSFLEDSLLKETVQQYYGIRILQQDHWETLLSFIFSSTNNIKRIKSFLEKLCIHYGQQIGEMDFTFPVPERLAYLTEQDFRALGAGYRAPYLLDCAQQVASGRLDLHAVSVMDLAEARAALMQIKGVGPKVAECVLLFGYGKMEAFPVDRWIQRVLALYPNGLPSCFHGYEGIAQQYMFHYARMHLSAK